MIDNEMIPIDLKSVWDRLPLHEPPLIDNILRRNQKLMIKGPSKSGKTMLSIQLAVAISEGKEWLGNQCDQGKVLYINFGLPTYSMFSRVREIYTALNIAPENLDDINILNYKGNYLARNYTQFIDHMKNIASENEYKLIIVDCMDYVQGFYNTEAGRDIIRLLDNLILQINTCIAFTTSIDNPLVSNLCESLIELIPTEERAISDYRLSIETSTFPPKNQELIKINYPIVQRIGSSYNEHKMSLANKLKKEKSLKELEGAFDLLNTKGDGVDVNKLASYLGIARESLYRKIKKFEGFEISSGVVERINNT
ncbi:AAA family ATPase [Enterococcus italicus]|uniref:AAA family ATPase n=1 Tax=Enterococcus italicus TaxID=246144 RepID=UPI002073A5C1|nr:AAA family ATPase [Enterococcus italicus]MCM6932012.1 AAA family ATPase [Enterococcus italicus]